MANAEMRIQELLRRIDFEFTQTSRPNMSIVDSVGDDGGAADMEQAFGTLTWQQAAAARIHAKFDSTELGYHLAPSAFCYYLPAFLIGILKEKSFGWFERLLIPCIPGYEDVAEEFGGGTLYPFEGSIFVERQRRRLDFVKSAGSPGQLRCVAEYIGLSESCQYGAQSGVLLHKFQAFWTDQAT